MASLPFSSPLGLSPLGTLAPVILLRFPCVAVFPLLETKPREINCGGVHDVPPPRSSPCPVVQPGRGRTGFPASYPHPAAPCIATARLCRSDPSLLLGPLAGLGMTHLEPGPHPPRTPPGGDAVVVTSGTAERKKQRITSTLHQGEFTT